MKNILIHGKEIPDSIDCSLAYHGFEDLEYSPTLIDNWLTLSATELSNAICCVTGVALSRWILSKLGIKNFDIPCYPKQLHHFLFRNISELSLKDIIKSLPPNKFIKPLKPKLFNAFTTNSPNIENSLFSLINLNELEKIYVLDLIEFKSEWRVYVKSNEIQNICFYNGNCKLFPNTNTIDQMISSFLNAPCCYALDVGVADISEKSLFNITTLVEINDFYSIGNYGLNPTTYAEMLLQRWQQLTEI